MAALDRPPGPALCAAGAIPAAAAPGGGDCPTTLFIDPTVYFAEETFTLEIEGTPFSFLWLLFDTSPGPTFVPAFGTFDIGFTEDFQLLTVILPESGKLDLSGSLPCDAPRLGDPFSAQALVLDPFLLGTCISNPVTFVVNPLPDGCPPDCDGELGDFVFEDLNNNGIQDANEPGIPDVTLTLLDDMGNELGTTVTGPDGFCSFMGLCAGEYTVVPTKDDIPLNLVRTLCNVGTNTATDSSCGSERTTLPDDMGFDPTFDFGFANCGPCDGKVNALSLAYNGPANAFIEVEQKDGTTLFADFVDPGQPFTFFGQKSDEMHLDTEIRVFVDGVENVKIHTSCSQPIAVGFEFGAFTVLAGSSVDGGPLCECLGCEVDKPEALLFEYTGLGCDASNTPQEGKATCSGDPNMEPAVQIVVSNENRDKIFFSGTVLLGETFEALSNLAGEDDFPSNTVVEISAVGGDVLQTLEIHTSCSQPLAVGNQFGSMLLIEFTPEP